MTLPALLALGACQDDNVTESMGNSLGSVAIAGDAYIGSTLSANITDNNGYDSAGVSYTWMLNDEVIAGATSESYVIVEADNTSTITVSVSYVDSDGYNEIAKSFATEAIRPVPVNTEGSLEILGDAYVGDVLTAILSDPNGTGDNAVDYAWMADGSEIADADAASYTLTSADLGSQISVSATYIDNDGFEEAVVSAQTDAVIEEPDFPSIPLTQVAQITDNMSDDAGELRYKHSGSIEAGKMTVSFAKDTVVTAGGSAKEAYIALYGSSTSTNNALVDLRIGNGTYTIRNSDIVVSSTFTPGDWVDVEMTWDATSASATVAPKVTLTINGTAVTSDAFDSESADFSSVMDGVETVVFKLSDTSSIVTGAYIVDDFVLYSDLAGTTEAFADDFEGYSVDDSLDTDNASSPYNSSTAEAVVAETEGRAVAAPPLTQAAQITDNMADDAGELRYKHSSTIEAGKMTVSFAKDAVVTAGGSAKEAYIALYGSSTSTNNALVDLRIGNGTYTIRNSDIVVSSTFTPGDWVNVEMTWDATSASATVAPKVTLTINGSAVTSDAFDSVSADFSTVMDGVETVVFKLSDTSSVVTGAYVVDDFVLYSDVAGTTEAFADDFEDYSVDDSLDTDNDASPYNSSTAEAIVIETEGQAVAMPTENQVASITDNMGDDAGELRYKHSSTIEAGKMTVSFAKDAVVTAGGSEKEAYIALYGSSTSTNNALVDLRIGNGSYTIRNSDTVVSSTFTPGDWIDVVMTWDATSASATVAPKVTLTINGSAVTSDAFDSVSADFSTVMDGVETVVFKLSDTSSIVTGAYKVDDFVLYSDIAGTTEAFADDFEGYSVGDSLDTDNASSPYNSSTAEAVVAQVIR